MTYPKMSTAQILARWPSINATVEQRKRQLDEIGVEDIADDVADTTRQFLDGTPAQRNTMADRDLVLLREQVLVNRRLGIN